MFILPASQAARACNPIQQSKLADSVKQSCSRFGRSGLILSTMLLLAACGGSGQGQAGGGSGRGGNRGPAQGGFVVVQMGSAPLQQELRGRGAAYQVADVRPRVSG